MMNEIKPKLDFEPIDKYEKAKKDLIQAMLSIRDLSSVQQEQLVREFVGVEGMAVLINFMNMIQRPNN